jgi:putative peptidoglycan lipid II flippase
LAHAGLALSIGLGALVNALWLLVGLLRRGSYKPQPGWWRFGFQVLLATGLLTGLLWFAANHLPWVAMRQEAWLRIGWMGLVLLGSAVLYFGVLWATGLRLKAFLKR